ncbi:MAG: AAA family ATPase [Anaerolineae bacterium]|nr:AAA family ATPase [Anaerolineae bacterium]
MTTEERLRLEETVTALEAQRAVLGDLVVDTDLQPLREKLAALQPEPLTDERKPVTILLADVKGSTDLAERLSMETWVDVMNHLLQIMQAEVYRFGGVVNQFRGDGLLAFFGASVVREDDPERAVLAGLAMQEVSRPYAAELAAREGVEVLLRVGVNTGEVIVTHVGDRRLHSEDTAMGRAVALAARMETSAEPGSVLVSEDTYRLVRHLFEWESLGEIQVKGIHRPVGVYRPRLHHPSPGKGRGVAGLASPLVGRNLEFRSLQTVVLRLQAGAGGIVTLVGEAGLGKSRLVAELRQWATAQLPGPDAPGPQFLQWVEGRCVSYDTSSAYLLWLDVLRAMLGMEVEDSLDAIRAALHDRVAALCEEVFDEVYPYLYRLLSLDPAVDSDDKAVAPRAGPEGERLKQGTFHAIARLLSQAARSYPMVVVCEDLHWADPTSLDLLEHLLPLTEQVPLLFICVSRPEKSFDASSGRILRAIAQYPQRRLNLELVPLDAMESETLVRNLLRVENLPPALKSRILRYADGNPFYLEEILRSLMADGAIAYRPVVGCWEVTRAVSDIAIPETLYGVLIARIDRLPADTKRILQLAAIIGRIFAGDELEVVAVRCGLLAPGDAASPDDESPPGDVVPLERHLEILEQAELIRERPRKAERRTYSTVVF